MCVRAGTAGPCAAVNPKDLSLGALLNCVCVCVGVAKGVCKVAKLATLCISISPTTGWATGPASCINHTLIKLVPLKLICVNAFTLKAQILIHQILER